MILLLQLLFVGCALAAAPDQTTKNGLMAGTFFLCVFIVPFPYSLLYGTGSINIMNYLNALFWINLIFSLWAYCVLWVNFYPEIVRFNNWYRTTFTTISIDPNAYTCCELTNCQCQDYLGVSCDELINSEQSGNCQRGYFCCDCNYCKIGGTCNNGGCVCTDPVQFQLCQSVCGSCYNPVLEVSFYNQDDVQIFGSFTGQCSLNDVDCDDQFNQYGPPGNNFMAYYNSDDNSQIAFDVSYNKGLLTAFLIPAIGLAITTLINISIWLYRLTKYLNIRKRIRKDLSLP